MKRVAINLLSFVSLLLCGVSVWLWVSGEMGHFERYYAATWSNESESDMCTCVNAATFDGRIYLSWEKMSLSNPARAAILRQTTIDGFHHSSFDPPPDSGIDPLGENHNGWALGRRSASRSAFSSSTWRVLLPAWAVTLLTAILPIIWSIRAFRVPQTRVEE